MANGRKVRGDSLKILTRLGVPVLVIVILYFGRDVLLPVALATLLSLILVPIVNPLERVGLPRLIAVVMVATVAFGLLGGLAYVVGGQMAEVAGSLPQYRQNIRERAQALHSAGESEALEKLAELGEDVSGEMRKAPKKNAGDNADAPLEGPLKAPREMALSTPSSTDNGEEADSGPPDPIPVEVHEPAPAPLEVAVTTISPLLGPLATAGMIIVLVLFMLLQRDDLRDRLLWVAGATRLHLTTKAIDEGTGRISRYLLMQLLINVSYGLPVGIGLWFIGVPGAVLWGFLATVLRFVPYVGPWIAASMPILMSLAVFEGWTLPLMVAGMFIVLELFSNNVLEPWLYGSSTGMSPMAVLIAAIFWSWLWGPVGLVLAVPLTACLVVAGRHVPALRPVAVLLGDDPAFTPPQRFYQRLLAYNEDDAWKLARRYLNEHGRTALYDRLLLPALCYAEIEQRRGHVDEEQRDFIHDTVREILADHAPSEDRLPDNPSAAAPVDAPLVMCLSGRDADDMAAEMLEHRLREDRVVVRRLPPSVLTSEAAEQVRKVRPSVVCVSATPPGAARRARYQCVRIHEANPQLPILVALWSTRAPSDHLVRRLHNSGARWVVWNVEHALPRIRQALGTASPTAATTPDAKHESAGQA